MFGAALERVLVIDNQHKSDKKLSVISKKSVHQSHHFKTRVFLYTSVNCSVKLICNILILLNCQYTQMD